MPGTVTVGVDGSRESLAAADWAADEALGRDRGLRLVHVWDDADVLTNNMAPETQRQVAGELLDSAAAHVHRRCPGVRVETSQVSGDPVEVLTAAGEGADLLALGSRGLGGVTGFIAGSVSLAVLARVRHPVVLVRAWGPSESEPGPAAGDVVLGVDLPPTSDDALAFAFEYADRHGCGLRAVYSWTPPPVYGPGTVGILPRFMEVPAERQKELEAAVARAAEKYPGVAVSRQCGQGRAAQDLVEASRGARLLVVGLRHRRSRLGAHIGPVVHSVLHHASCPVAVVPHD